MTAEASDGPIADAEPATLVEHQQALADAIQQLLNGPARRRERAAFLALRTGYEQALHAEAARMVHHRFLTSRDETLVRGDLVRLVAGSVTEVVGDAHRDHYETSVIERVRHFFELTGRRRLAVALLNALLFGAITAVAVQTVEALPSINNTRALATGAGVLGFALRYVRPRTVVRALLGASGGRLKERARAGVNKHPGDVMQEIRHEVADVQDRELRRRIRYELLAERHYGPMVRVALSDTLLDARLATPAQQDHAVAVAARTAVEWLYALYGIDLAA